MVSMHVRKLLYSFSSSLYSVHHSSIALSRSCSPLLLRRRGDPSYACFFGFRSTRRVYANPDDQINSQTISIFTLTIHSSNINITSVTTEVLGFWWLLSSPVLSSNQPGPADESRMGRARELHVDDYINHLWT
jgi:hypothetical protein